MITIMIIIIIITASSSIIKYNAQGVEKFSRKYESWTGLQSIQSAASKLSCKNAAPIPRLHVLLSIVPATGGSKTTPVQFLPKIAK